MSVYLTSPPFEYVIPKDLPAGETFTKNLEMVTGSTGDYSPFNSIVVDNFSAQTIKVLYGSGHFVFVRGNSMAVIEQNGIRSFSVENITATATDSFIVVYIQKRITADIALESMARKIPIEKLMGV